MSLFSRLKSGLVKSASKISDGISAAVTGRKLDDATLEELEELLISADLGPGLAAEIIADFAKNKFGKEITSEEIQKELAEKINSILAPLAKPLEFNPENKPEVVLVVGVNGNGKTTTVGKLAMKHKQQGRKVILAACDTFRAAAGEQLQIWADRAGCPLIKGEKNADPASVAYQALETAEKENADVLFIDTAGRLHNKTGLMEELSKISRVLKKIDEAAPHHVILVLDATTGQNAISQLEEFSKIANVTGLVITKLDGTAKGGIIVALARKFSIPIHAIGIGEAPEDLQDFNSSDFANALVGVSG